VRCIGFVLPILLSQIVVYEKKFGTSTLQYFSDELNQLDTSDPATNEYVSLTKKLFSEGIKQADDVCDLFLAAAKSDKESEWKAASDKLSKVNFSMEKAKELDSLGGPGQVWQHHRAEYVPLMRNFTSSVAANTGCASVEKQRPHFKRHSIAVSDFLTAWKI